MPERLSRERSKPGPKRIPPEVRFQQYVVADEKTGCLNFTGSGTGNGYGIFWAGHSKMLAHRFAWEQEHGAIPEGMQIDHLCRNRRCVNPDHMEVVSSRENTLRGESIAAIRARASHCQRGHAFDEANTGWYTDTKGRSYRFCRTCDRVMQRRWRGHDDAQF